MVTGGGAASAILFGAIIALVLLLLFSFILVYLLKREGAFKGLSKPIAFMAFIGVWFGISAGLIFTFYFLRPFFDIVNMVYYFLQTLIYSLPMLLAYAALKNCTVRKVVGWIYFGGLIIATLIISIVIWDY